MSTKLRLPLETIERILHYAFGADHPPSTPNEYELIPPPSTSHLLLVSKGFRSLCLSLFYRSITITRSHDYFTFFDPNEGVFTNPKDGEERAQLVKELKVNVACQIPIDLPCVRISFGISLKAKSYPHSFILILLGSPKFINLENVSFLDAGMLGEERVEAVAVDELETSAGRLPAGDEDYRGMAIDFYLAERSRD